MSRERQTKKEMFEFSTKSSESLTLSDLLVASNLWFSLVSTVATTVMRSDLWSGKTTNYCLPRFRTKFGEWAFSYSGPAAWNRLPQDILASPSL